ncbi:MAG: 3-deoxy-manno-octulosonate cytidylyltransferase [Phycisphaeraceae bacterium]
MHTPAAIAIIPARFASTRLPGKPLLDRTGKPLIQHVVERAAHAASIDRVIVATDDERIRDAVLAFHGEAVMTAADHPNGTSRIAETITLLRPALPADAVLVNVQGDEPEIDPSIIDQLVHALAHDRDAPMATIASPFAEGEDASNPNLVKLVTTAVEPRRALYFSRSLIPCVRSNAQRPHHAGAERSEAAGTQTSGSKTAGPSPLKHVGLYAYRAGFLPRYAALPPTPLEQAERLEQLRALEHGHPIAVRIAHAPHPGIDTPEQYDAFVKRYLAAK